MELEDFVKEDFVTKVRPKPDSDLLMLLVGYFGTAPDETAGELSTVVNEPGTCLRYYSSPVLNTYIDFMASSIIHAEKADHEIYPSLKKTLVWVKQSDPIVYEDVETNNKMVDTFAKLHDLLKEGSPFIKDSEVSPGCSR